ncbi:MAG: hypothetical protein ABR591_12225 [Candidatus Velthaea sp.]
MNPRSIGLAAIAALALGSSAVSLAQTAPGPATTPPPPPRPNTNQTQAPIITATTAPTPLPSGALPPTSAPTQAPRGRGRNNGTPGPSPSAGATETPEPPQFSTMDGVWEVQLQPLGADRAVYSHLFVTQKGANLTGLWQRDAKTKLPFTGTFDGRLFKLTITDGKKSFTMTGYAENFGDMVGLLNDDDPKHDGTPFTASHRKKQRLTG